MNDGWDENDEDAAPYIPPPRLLNAVRLFLPYKGYVEVGHSLSSDGYGNVSAEITMTIAYGDEWLSLREHDVAAFFCGIRDHGYWEVAGTYYGEPASDFRGFLQIEKSGATFNILFREEEGDECSIKAFQEDDVVGLLKMEPVIAGQLESAASKITSVIEDIEGVVRRCEGDPEIIKINAKNWHCDPIEVELAINHFQFFFDLINEVQRPAAE